jgi:translation initiation factor IF-2
MTMLTVDDLARDLKVRNEDLLRELTSMGYHVEGPESSLETDDPAALRAQLVTVLPQREVDEKRIKPTVIRRRVKKPSAAELAADAAVEALVAEVEETLPPSPREPKRTAAEGRRIATKEPSGKPPKKIKKPEAARIIELPRKPEPATTAPVTERAEQPRARREVREVAEAAPAADTGAVPVPDTLESPQPPKPPLEARADVEPRAATEPSAEPTGEAPSERQPLEERQARRKKKKEKRMQPAQIIGKVELKKEVPKEPEREKPEPLRVVVPVTPPRRVEVREITPLAVGAETVLTEEEKRQQRKKKERKDKGIVEERVETDQTKVRRRKEVLLRDALYDDRRPGRLRAKGKKTKQRKTELTTPKASKRRIRIPELVSVANLAHKMSVKSSEVIRHLMTLGVTSTVNEAIDFDTASIVATEFGFEAESSMQTEQDLLPILIKDAQESLVARPPVITVMGHVDHGKTSLLDFIRSTHVTDQEAGGITQHIGAYKVKLDRGEVVFLDTPGHEAFTAMRARGAQVTDFVVLVVAADDGVMEQTREAINHAKAAHVPIIVAVNKIDKPEADRDRVTRELSEFELIPEAWGGDTLYTYVSAKTGEGINDLLDTIILQAELMELKANPKKVATGTVVEARLDKGKGPIATVLVKDGTVKLGDPFVAGVHHGKVRAMLDHEGRPVETAGPATPVELQGLSGVPEAGDLFMIVEDEKVSRQVAEHRQQKRHRLQEESVTPPVSLEDLLARMQAQETKDLNIIVKADVQGSAEALREALLGLSAQEIKVKVIHVGVGAITESDIMLASASHAIIIGFNVRPTPKASHVAEQERIDVRLYTVIYEALEDVRKAMEGMLTPIEKETIVGRAEVRQTFHVPKVGNVAGCYVVSGKIERPNQVRLLRDNVVVYTGRMVSMKRYKDDIKEALEGYECGIALDNYKDVKIGDIIEAFTIEQEAAKLSS